ncbi:MAG: ferritin-like protein [Actinomycetota bacterium]|nr:ferritin-like protein [Actinomycetota bacterium]
MAAADPALAELHEHLQAAVEVELSVIPPYLTALYSLQPDANQEAELIIRSVVVEEMLHLVLAANVLNAVGGRPRLPVPVYPLQLFEDLSVSLLPFGDEALETFLKIENPSYPIAAPMLAAGAVPSRPMVLGYDTIGAFYDAVLAKLELLVHERGEPAVFTGDPARQVGPEQYYGSGGTARRVTGLASAKEAICDIVEQGEGEAMPVGEGQKFDEEHDLAHYYRFFELKARRRFKADDRPSTPTGPPIDLDLAKVYPMRRDPRVDDLPPEVRPQAHACNALWCGLLAQVEEAFDGRPDRMRDAVMTMFDLKYTAQALLRIPIGDAENAGPTFEAVSLPPAGDPSPAASASRG